MKPVQPQRLPKVSGDSRGEDGCAPHGALTGHRETSPALQALPQGGLVPLPQKLLDLPTAKAKSPPPEG
jgi:hypothetical protein